MKSNEAKAARAGFGESDRLAILFASILSCLLCSQLLVGYSLVSWNLSEWLINYAGGFVRRGLPGAIILQLSQTTGSSPYWWAIGASLGALIVAAIAIARRSRGRLHRYVLCSPILFGGAILGDFWFRKDVIGVVSLLLCLGLLFGEWLPRHRMLRLAAANLLCILMLLSHEAYGFYALPILVLANAAERVVSARGAGGVRALCVSALEFSPSVAAFLTAVAFRGSEAHAQAVHQSWSALYFPYDAGGPYPDLPKAAIEGIGWTTATGLDQGLATLTSFSGGIYVPLAWLATVYLSARFLVGALRSPDESATTPVEAASSPVRPEGAATDRQRFVLVMSLQLLAVSPLFVLGRDYGRWIFLWGLSSTVIYLFAPGPVLDALPGRKFLSSFSGRSRRIVALHPAFLLLFGIPPADWTVGRYVWSTPLGVLLAALERLAITVRLG